MDVRKRAVAAVLAGLIAGVCGCGDNSRETASPAPQVLRVATAESRCTIAPMGMTGLSPVSYGMAELLVRPLADGGVAPWLAESFVQERPDLWRFQLREGVRFHNGRQMDADAVVASLRHVAKESFTRDAVTGGTLTVTGPREFTLTTEEPLALAPNALASIYSYPIYDVAAAERAGKDETALVAAGVYTGPFRPVAVTGQVITTERFEGYWGTRPHLPGVELRCVGDAQARVSAVRAGEVDIALSPPPGVATVLGNDQRAVLTTAKTPTEATFLQLNLGRAPFDELPVRQAFALGIDYAAVSRGLGLGEPATGLYPAAAPWTARSQRTDPAAATRLLDEAGWTAGPDGVRVKNGRALRVTYLWSESPAHETIGVLLRDQLRTVGFDVRPRQVEAHYDDESWPAEWHLNANPMTMDGLGNDPTQVLHNWLGPGAQNFGRVRDAHLDRIVAEARQAPAPRRNDLLREAQRIISAQGYAVVAAFAPVEAVVGTAYRGFRPDPKQLHISPELGTG
ncbi:ABC transporter substrate-binding protein [Actinomycetes bacterium KLBMP 9797]